MPSPTRPDVDLCVVFRTSPDWGCMTPGEFDAQARRFCLAVNRPAEQVVRTARLWDETFRTSYRETRHALKEIARAALAWTRDWETFDAPPAVTRPAAVYVLTDDDDWFSPELPAALADARAADDEGVVWDCAGLGPLKKDAAEPILEQPAAVRFRAAAEGCQSNNYGLCGRYFERPGASWDEVYRHGHADREFRALNVRRISRCLSVKNTNPASTVFLENGLRGEFSSRRLRELVAQYNARFDAGGILDEPTLQWARSSMAAVRDLFRER